MNKHRHHRFTPVPTDKTLRGIKRWNGGLRCFLFSVTLSAPIIATRPALGATQSAATSRPALPSCMLAKSIQVGADKTEYKYAIFLPKAYDADPERKWPMLLFLHGSGECGDDGVKQTSIGLPLVIQQRCQSFPFICIMPQAHTKWFADEDEVAVWQMLEATVAEYRVDLDRISITGLSMGGFATWDFIAKRPDVFAAAIPICGVGDPRFVTNARNMPIWAFHGADDPLVPVSGSRDAIQALKDTGGDPKYTEYSDGRHDVWNRVYNSDDVFEWLLASKKRPPPQEIEYRMLQGAARAWWLQLRAETHLSAPPLIRARASRGNVEIQTEGVSEFFVASAGEPIPPAATITLRWNKIHVFEGRFPGVIRVIHPQAILPTMPAETPPVDASPPTTPPDDTKPTP